MRVCAKTIVARMMPRMNRTWKVVVIEDEVVATMRSVKQEKNKCQSSAIRSLEKMRTLTSRHNTRQHQRRNHAKQTLRTPTTPSATPPNRRPTIPLSLPRPPLPLLGLLPHQRLDVRPTHIRMVDRRRRRTAGEEDRQPSKRRSVPRRREEAAASFFVRLCRGCQRGGGGG